MKQKNWLKFGMLIYVIFYFIGALTAQAKTEQTSTEFDVIMKGFCEKVNTNVEYTSYGTNYNTGTFVKDLEGMQKYLPIIQANPDYWNFYVQANELVMLGKTADEQLRLLRKKYPEHFDSMIMDRYWQGVFKLPNWNLQMNSLPYGIDKSVIGTVMMLVRQDYHYKSVIFLRNKTDDFVMPLPKSLRLKVHPILHQYKNTYIYVLVCVIGDNPNDPLRIEVFGSASMKIPATLITKEKMDWSPELFNLLNQNSIDIVCIDLNSNFIFKQNLVFDQSTLTKLKQIKATVDKSNPPIQNDTDIKNAIMDYQKSHLPQDFGW